MKYSALSLLLTAAALLVLAWYFPPAVQPVSAHYNLSTVNRLTQAVTVEADFQRSLERASSQAAKLQALPVQRNELVRRTIIEARPVVADQPVVEAAPRSVPAVREYQAPPEPKDYDLSMIFVGPGGRYAVIDGRFRREGDVLPGGSRVTTIREGEVVVVTQGLVQQLSISR